MTEETDTLHTHTLQVLVTGCPSGDMAVNRAVEAMTQVSLRKYPWYKDWIRYRLWATASRFADIKKLERRDAKLMHVGSQKVMRFTFRGIKGSALGATNHVRWITIKGEYTILKYYISKIKTKRQKLFKLTRSSFVRVFKKTNFHTCLLQ